MTWRETHARPCLDALLALELVLGQHLRAGGRQREGWGGPFVGEEAVSPEATRRTRRSGQCQSGEVFIRSGTCVWKSSVGCGQDSAPTCGGEKKAAGVMMGEQGQTKHSWRTSSNQGADSGRPTKREVRGTPGSVQGAPRASAFVCECTRGGGRRPLTHGEGSGGRGRRRACA
jgi:hypothetical protein